MSGRKIVLAASDSESNEYLRSTWRQMLLATLPARYARYVRTDWSIKNEIAPDGQAKYVPHGLRIVESLLLRSFHRKISRSATGACSYKPLNPRTDAIILPWSSARRFLRRALKMPPKQPLGQQ